MAIETGRTEVRPAVIDAPTRTTSAASVAYATEESGSDAKIGKGKCFREQRLAHLGGPREGRPIRARFKRVEQVRALGRYASSPRVPRSRSFRRLTVHATRRIVRKRLVHADFEGFLRPCGRPYAVWDHSEPRVLLLSRF